MNNYSSQEKQILIAVGLKIKTARLSLNLSQEELADLCGLHRTYISSTERGERNISILNIFKICKSIKIPPHELLEGCYESKLD
ncbi:helix-turn-helix domain-containing protein [Brenneria salicis]|uniref:helix-turn-helix domain-containing protein n=1 Tax=Brenneria salicis TaxID=55214 RepID=UPI000DE8C0E9|nr:helix-turn-helix transcriptional regulator [Brenneria salicis]